MRYAGMPKAATDGGRAYGKPRGCRLVGSLVATVAMLETWLRPFSLDSFRATHLRRAPLARPSTALDARGLFDWAVLERVLAAEPPARDVFVVARGEEVAVATPRTLVELRALMGRGIGLCIRGAERWDAGLAAVASAFELDLGPAQVQLFVTPGGTHGFGWHYDDEDVFIVQTAGMKEYHFRPNTVAADVPAHPSAFARFARETSVAYAATLVGGDFLYVPARWWHMARCREEALSISIGVRPWSAELAAHAGPPLR